MELKRHLSEGKSLNSKLLIVPYGIETIILMLKRVLLRLLIVPYGIETSWSPAYPFRSILLIVPYGIETSEVFGVGETHFVLLIVPYGIETSLSPRW